MDGAPRDCFTINRDCCFEFQFCHVLEIFFFKKKKDLKAKVHFQDDSVSGSAEPFPHKNKQSGKNYEKQKSQRFSISGNCPKDIQ